MTIDDIENKERQKLIAARLKAGFETVHEAAEVTGYSAKYLRGMERGKFPLTPKSAGRLAVVYGCGISDLIDH
ncbi:helix-turn-helix domain-containing protein [Brevibacillus borstelensis]|uniref:helix-turn-helix domain-containing protein n=1 Tax=Brevibacillus borstelensis TaxID=45462 RepID=UPI0030BD9D35